MSNRSVLYVEDEDAEPVPSFTALLESSGFAITRARSAQEARVFLREERAAELDLVVLDRKIPSRSGGVASEAVGDALFSEINDRHVDIPIVVLSGYTDEDHARWVLQRPGDLHLSGAVVRRFQHYRKGDSIEFQASVEAIGRCLMATDAVELEGSVVGFSKRRLLKRVAQLLGGTAIRARASDEGHTDALVWLCEVMSADGRRVANVAVKAVPVGGAKPTGGFMASIRSNMRSTPTDVVQGCCGGLVGVVSPLAGAGARPLQAVLLADESAAHGVALSVLGELALLDRSQRQVPVSDVGNGYFGWAAACDRLRQFGLVPPDESLPVHVTFVQAHGDLHPGNVLVLEEQPPCVIDFDSQFAGSAVFDPLMLGLGAVFNRAGALRSVEWTVEAIVSVLRGEEPIDLAGRWVRLAVDACLDRQLVRREFWAVLLVYCAKQLKYDDVVDEPRLRQLAIALAELSLSRLADS